MLEKLSKDPNLNGLPQKRLSNGDLDCGGAHENDFVSS
jgi:hypothetical protein